MEKNCLSCGSKITGRADKKYCNDACKNDFHNRQPIHHPNFEKTQISRVRKNHKILNKITAAGIGEIGEKELELYGFNFEGLTGLKLLEKNKFQLFCFNYTLRSNGNSFTISKNTG